MGFEAEFDTGEAKGEAAEAIVIRDKKMKRFWTELLYIIDKHGGQAEYPDVLYGARLRADVGPTTSSQYLKDLTCSEGPLTYVIRSDGQKMLTRRPPPPRKGRR